MRVYHVTIPLTLVFLGASVYLASANRKSTPEVANPYPRHPVTKAMEAGSKAMGRKSAPAFELTGVDGKKHTLAELATDKPVFLYFILKGCPCNIESEPIFQALQAHHEGRIYFVGVINAGDKDAKKYVTDNGATSLILSDTSVKTMKEYKSPQSVYSTLIATDGTIIKQWPGWSKNMLTEANQLMSEQTGQPVRPFDTQYAPIEPSSGCSFYPH